MRINWAMKDKTAVRLGALVWLGLVGFLLAQLWVE